MAPHPDSELFPHATGAAKNLVDAHQKEEDIKLYAGWFCPFVQRTWLTLEELKIPYQYIEINPYHKSESLLSLNPRGLVPTLSAPTATGPKPLYESNIICEYLIDLFPNATPKLLPADPYKKAVAKIWIDYVTSRIIPAYHRFLQYDGSDDGIDKPRQEFLGHLKEWIDAADSEGPYFLGEEISLVDIALAPWAVRLWAFDEFKHGGLGLPETEAWARWRKWANAIEQRKSIQDTTSEREPYLKIYKRYADNTAQSELAKATRSGKGVP